MTGTPVRNLATDTFALFGEESDPGRVLHRYSVSRSLLDEATVPVMLDPHPVVFEMDDQALQAEFDQFADDFDLDDPDREALSRKFGRLTSVFANPDRVHAVCQDIVDHYLAGAYRNGLKAQVVAFNRELAVAYTDTINELLAGFEASQALAEVGRHERITAEVNISVSDSKDEDPAMRPYRLSEAEEEEQKRRFLTPDDPLCFLVVTAKLMTGFDAPNEGVLYLDKPLKAHTLFQTITRPNRTWVSPTGFVKTCGVVVDYIGLAEEVQRAVTDPTAQGTGKGGGFVTDLSDAGRRVPRHLRPRRGPPRGGRRPGSHGPRIRVRAGHQRLPGRRPRRRGGVRQGLPAAGPPVPAHQHRQAGRQVPRRLRAVRIGVHDPLQEVLRRGEARNGWRELGPMVLEIINAHVHSFTAVAAQEEPLVLDAQGIAILKELLALVRPRADQDDGEDAGAAVRGGDPGRTSRPPSTRASNRDRRSTPPSPSGYGCCGTGSSRTPRTPSTSWPKRSGSPAPSSTPQKHPDEAVVVLDDDHVGVLSRIIRDHAPAGLTITERNLAEEIDQVVTRTLARSWDNADARSRGVRRATAAVFRRYSSSR